MNKGDKKMDELEFRRRIYANPNSTEQDVNIAAAQDESKEAFWQEIKDLDDRVKDAFKIPVPDDLASKLILQQSLQDFSRQKKRNRWYIAMAASFAFMCGIGLTSWYQQHAQLGHAALAHMEYAENEIPIASTPVSMQQVNLKLEQFGAHLSKDIGHIEVANYCLLDSTRSLHLIVTTELGKMSVFIVPENEKLPLSNTFTDGKFIGTGFTSRHANIMVVGDKDSDLFHMEEKLKQSLMFSA
jgi:hypothetical protein